MPPLLIMSIAAKCACGKSIYCVGGDECFNNKETFEQIVFGPPKFDNEQQETNEIAQLLNDIKYGKQKSELDLWVKVAEEFHYDKPFHETVRLDIINRLIAKGFKLIKV